MKLLVSTALLSLALALPQVAGAQGGTIMFIGALVEPTCQAQVMDAQPHHGQLAVRLNGCLLPSPVSPAHSTGDSAQVTGPLRVMDLSAPVAAVAGRDRVELMTLSYL